MKKIIFLFIVFISLITIHSYSQNKADDITGVWLTRGNEPAKVQVYKSGEKFYGKIIWLKNATENGRPGADVKNPDAAKRNRLIVGLIIITEFKFNGDDEWTGGTIYDPENGKTYSSYIYLPDKNTLKVRGFVGISLPGRTETWIRTN